MRKKRKKNDEICSAETDIGKSINAAETDLLCEHWDNKCEKI